MEKRVVRFIRNKEGIVINLETSYFDLKRSQKDYIGKRFVRYFSLFMRQHEGRMPSRTELRDVVFPMVYQDIDGHTYVNRKNETITTRKINITKENLWIYMYKFTHKLLQNYYPEFELTDERKEVLRSYGNKI